jgi:hypothetical protein
VEERENDVECWELKNVVLSFTTILDGLRKVKGWGTQHYI